MREECGERGSLDFRIRVLRSLVLGVAVPARTGKQRNRIWSQNEICGCDSFLCRTLWPFRWARKPTPNQAAPPSVGLEIGQLAPAFALSDQFGHEQSNQTLKGPKGIVLLFFRSADW